MRTIRREVTKAEYDEAMANNGKVDEVEFFGMAVCCGYGLYGYSFYEEDGKYYVSYSTGSNCD